MKIIIRTDSLYTLKRLLDDNKLEDISILQDNGQEFKLIEYMPENEKLQDEDTDFVNTPKKRGRPARKPTAQKAAEQRKKIK